MATSTPTLDGFWHREGENNITEIRGNEGQMRQLWEFDMTSLQKGKECTFNFGEFHDTIEEIKEKTGKQHYEFEMKVEFFGPKISIFGVVSQDGKSIWFDDTINKKVKTLQLLSEKQELLDSRTHEDDLIPPGFTPQPENQGRIIFICGPPGSGKSTTAQLMAKAKGWVYYEADCFLQCLNPFVDLDTEEPSIAQMRQKPIKGRSVEALECMKGVGPEFEKMLKNVPFNEEKMKSYFKNLAENILQHKTRLGGTFAVAYACPNREVRDCMKEVFGSQCTFITLRLSKEAITKRLEVRHSNLQKLTEVLTSIYDMFEDAQPGEENCVTVLVDPDDSREDVMNKILSQVDQ